MSIFEQESDGASMFSRLASAVDVPPFAEQLEAEVIGAGGIPYAAYRDTVVSFLSIIRGDIDLTDDQAIPSESGGNTLAILRSPQNSQCLRIWAEEDRVTAVDPVTEREGKKPQIRWEMGYVDRIGGQETFFPYQAVEPVSDARQVDEFLDQWITHGETLRWLHAVDGDTYITFSDQFARQLPFVNAVIQHPLGIALKYQVDAGHSSLGGVVNLLMRPGSHA